MPPSGPGPSAPEESESQKPLVVSLNEALLKERGKSFPLPFIHYLEETNPTLLAELSSANLSGAQAEVGPFTKTQLATVEDCVNNFAIKNMRRDLEASGVTLTNLMTFDGKTFKIPCAGGALSLVRNGETGWLLDGVPYNQSNEVDLEEVAEDIAIIQKALAEVKEGLRVGNNNDPFEITGAKVLRFEGTGGDIHNVFENTIEASDVEALKKMLNKRYRILTGKEAPAPAVASSDSAERPTTAPRATPTSNPSGAPTATVTTSSSAPAGAPTASAETVTNTVASDADFVKYRLDNEGWKKYVTEIKDEDSSGKIVVKLPTDTTDPDYLYSRIHHFLGNKGVAELADPSKFAVTVNGQPVEWQNETWVNPVTKKRVPVVNGTTIEWKLKEAAVATAEPAAPEAAPAAPKYSAEKIAELTKSIVDDDGALRLRYLDLKERDAALASREKKVEGFFASLAPKKQEQARAEIQRERAMLASDYGDYEAELAEYKPYLADVQAIAFLDSTLPRVDERLAVLRDTKVVAPAVAGGEAPVTPPVTEGKKLEGDGVADAATE